MASVQRKDEVAGGTSVEIDKDKRHSLSPGDVETTETEGAAAKDSGKRAEISPVVPGGSKRGRLDTEKHDRGEAGGTRAEREQARRTLSAVLAELKRQGRIKTYALLMKAKIVSAAPGVVELGFMGGGSFSASVLRESGEIERVAEIWSEIAGIPVEIRLQGESIRGDDQRRDSGPGEVDNEPDAVPVSEVRDLRRQVARGFGNQSSDSQKREQNSFSDRGETKEFDHGSAEDSVRFERESKEDSRFEGNEFKGKGEGRSPGEIARLLKDEFGGEILK